MASTDRFVYLEVYIGGALFRVPGAMSNLSSHVYCGGQLNLWKVKRSRLSIWFLLGTLAHISGYAPNPSYFFEDVNMAGYRFLRRLETEGDVAGLARLGDVVAGIRVYIVNNIPELPEVIFFTP